MNHEYILLTSRQAVKEILLTQPTRIHKIYLAQTAHGPIITEIINLCRQHHVSHQHITPSNLDKISPNHQGIIAQVYKLEYSTLTELVNSLVNRDRVGLCMLDGIEDPHNFGAIIRTAVAFNIAGIIVPERNSVKLNDTVYRTSCGMVNKIPVVQVVNLVRCMEELKKEGFWIVGADSEATDTCRNYTFNPRTVLVLGGEGKGIRPLVKQNCDVILKISISNVSSLNVSVTAGIFFYELAARQ